MDYFSELLESYTKLKKRTFKLTYINEAEEKKEGKEEPTTDAATTAKAQEAADAAIAEAPEISSDQIAAKGLKVKNVVGEPTNMIIYKNVNTGAVGVQGLGPQGGILSIDKNVGTSTQPRLERNQEAYDEFVKKLSGESDLSQTAKDSLNQDEADAETAAAEAQQAETDRLTRMGTLGSLFDMDPERFPDAQELKDLEQSNLDQMDDLCSKKILPDHICASDRTKLQYIGGSRAMSLESKLVNGTGFVTMKDGKLERQQISNDRIKDVLQTNKQLLEEMGRAEPDCGYVGKRIGFIGKGKIVLFSNPEREEGESAEGVVLDRGGMHNAMLDKLKSCQTEGGIEAYQFQGSSADINEIKGRFNELFMGIMCRVYSTARSFRGQNLSDKQKQAELKPILNELADHVAQQRAELGEFAGETPLSEQGVELESYPLMEEVDRQINVYGNPEEIRNVMQQMLIQLGTLVKQVEADDIIPAGTAQTLGGKVDNYFLYVGDDATERANSRAKFLGLNSGDAIPSTPAQLIADAAPAKQEAIAAALARQGLSVDDDTTPIATLSVGNKMSVGGVIKFGDLRLSRGTDIVMSRELRGSAVPPDQEAYYAKLDESLQMDGADLSATQAYFKPIDTQVKRCGLVAQEATYAAEDGEITLTNPKQIAKSLGQKAISSFSYGQKKSAFYAACTKEVPNPHGTDPKTVRELADLQDPGVQKKMEESMQRDFLSQQFQRDLDSGDPVKVAGATNALCRMAGATIMEQTELSQIVTEEGEDSEPLVLNQNDILRGLGEARKNESLEINIKGGTTSFTFEVNGQRITYKTNMERQKGAAAVSGKIQKSEAEKAGKRVRRLKGRKKTENQDTMYEYLRGQISLLEELIKTNY